MEDKPKNPCSAHKESDAISFCEQCKIFMCNKCLNYHKELFKNHQQYKIDKNNNDIFIDICKEKGHEKKLEFFCIIHNELCCPLCIVKLNENGYGQHKDCDVCSIKNIKEEKKNKLNENIKYLQDLSNNLENSINELKTIFENINKSKQELKLYVQKVFTKIRSALNEREDKLLQEIDNKYNENFCKEDIIEESIKLPNKIKKYLEKGNISDDEWNDNNKLSSLINDCINIENNIKNIYYINDNIKNSKKFNDIKINFSPNEESINEFIQNIKIFGNIGIHLNYFDDSLILKNKDDSKNLIKLISNRIQIKSTKLLYRDSRDGHKFINLVDKIKNKSNLIFIYLTGNERIFGNYLNTKLENLGNYKDIYYKDENAFVFSLNNNKIYKILKPEFAIRFTVNSLILTGNNSNCNGFYFSGKGDIICDGSLLKEPKIYDFEKNENELTEGKNKFNELEIFEIN